MNRAALITVSLAGMLHLSAAMAATADNIGYQPTAAWVLPPPAVSPSTLSTNAALRFDYLDNQVHITKDGTEQDYSAYRVRIMKPEGLAAGNLTLTWQPDTGGMSVHYLHLIRDGQTSDILAKTKFVILQREAHLEQSVLTGQRTATLQIPGLQVGDELELAVTTSRHDAGLNGHSAGLMLFPLVGTPGTFRFRLSWPASHPLHWRASRDLPQIEPVTAEGQTSLTITLQNPSGPLPTDGAPPRYNIRRLVEYSDFQNWPDVSRDLAPMFERAATVGASSPIKAEVAAIASRTQDPVERTQAALQLVEDRIRYVFIALNGGNYIPATADETWQRRFGDCKAKAVLLIAVLRALGIEAEPALVNSHGGDGLDQRLPGPRLFDHMIVRTVVSGKVEWLDATRSGDRYLQNLPSPFRWALPLTASGAPLEKIPPHDDGLPALISSVDIDASAGFDQDAQVHVLNILHGDQAFATQAQLTSMTAEDADRALKAYWRNQMDWVTADKVSWRYDERRRTITLELTGAGSPGWKGDSQSGHTLSIIGAGFYAPDPMRRPTDQDQSAPWSVDYPSFRCWATTIHRKRPADAR